jgi:hypothetical protein
VCNHISVQKIIIEDNIYVYATITNYLTTVMNKSAGAGDEGREVKGARDDRTSDER